VTLEASTPAACYVVTGPMAAGKTTVAGALAGRFERSAHVRGDAFRRWIVRGRDPISPSLGEEAMRQLALRWRLAATVADAYWREGFTAVVQDIYAGEALRQLVDRLEAHPLFVVVLTPRADVVAAREATRSKSGYTEGWEVASHCEAFVRETPRLGLWIDTSELTVDATVEAILGSLPDARVR
jgi:predicted kinase